MTAEFEARLARLSPERRRLLEQLRSGRDGASAAVRDDGAVLLRPGDEPECLVLLHPSGGALFCYVPLIRALPPGRACSG